MLSEEHMQPLSTPTVSPVGLGNVFATADISDPPPRPAVSQLKPITADEADYNCDVMAPILVDDVGFTRAEGASRHGIWWTPSINKASLSLAFTDAHWQPEGDDDLVWFVRTLCRMLLATDLLSVNDQYGDPAWQYSRHRILLSCAGHSTYCKALKEEACDWPTLSPDESYDRWFADLELAHRVTGWPVTTATVAWDALLALLDYEVDEHTADPLAAVDVGTLMWLRTIAVCGVIRLVRRSPDLCTLSSVYRDGWLAPKVRQASTTIAANTVASWGPAIGLSRPFPRKGGSLFIDQLRNQLASFNLSILEPVTPPRVAEACPTVVVAPSTDIVVGRGRWSTSPIPSKLTATTCLRINWRSQRGTVCAMDSRVASRLPWYERVGGLPGVRLDASRSIDPPELSRPWDILARDCGMWSPWPWDEHRQHTELVARIAASLPAYWGALRDALAPSADVSGYAGWCPLVLAMPATPEQAGDTTASGKSTLMTTLGLSASLEAAAALYVFGDHQVTMADGVDTSQQGARGFRTTLINRGYALIEEMQEVLFGGGGGRAAIDLTTVASVVTGGVIPFTAAYGNAAQPVAVRYGIYGVAKWTNGSPDIINRSLPMFTNKGLPCDGAGYHRMVEGRTAYEMAVLARYDVTHTDLIKSYQAALQELSGACAWRFRAPSALLVALLCRETGVPLAEAVEEVNYWRSTLERRWKADDDVCRTLGAQIGRHDDTFDVDQLFEAFADPRASITRCAVLVGKFREVANRSYGGRHAGGFVDFSQFVRFVIEAGSVSAGVADIQDAIASSAAKDADVGQRVQRCMGKGQGKASYTAAGKAFLTQIQASLYQVRLPASTRYTLELGSQTLIVEHKTVSNGSNRAKRNLYRITTPDDHT